MKFIRLTSVFLCCALLSCFLSFPASAVDDMQYYSMPSVGSGEPSLAIEWPVSPAVSHDGFLAEDSQNLARIMTDLTTTGMTTLKSYIVDISDALSRGGSIYDFLSDITDALTNQNTHGTLAWYIKHSQQALDSLDASVQTISGAFNGQGLATETTLSAFKDLFTTGFFNVDSSASTATFDSSFADFLNSTFAVTRNGPNGDSSAYKYSVVWFNPADSSYDSLQYSFGGVLSTMMLQLTKDAKDFYSGYDWTLYHYVKNLSETLASEDDKQLAQNQKENREQIEQDFLTGQSGKTSLGKDDFGSLSSVGGTFKDISSLNGQASLDSFSSGLSDADTTGQGWFSQSTKDALDSVSGSTSSESTVSTFSDDGMYSVDIDPDPYNMGNFTDHYSWLCACDWF